MKYIDELKNKIRLADIEQTDWHIDILDDIPRGFATGYITAALEHLSDAMDVNTEDFRDEFLKVVSYPSIWK